jgi:SAM-dependent methyltransferase
MLDAAPRPGCPLCGAKEPRVFHADRQRRYWHCASCDLRFLDPACRLSSEAERQRYLLHENDVDDPGYRSFVQPLHDYIVEHVAAGSLGLDFGAGTVPLLTRMLSDSGYRIEPFDPFFHPFPELLERTYDFIVACEVVEHLFDPQTELARLHAQLRAGGLLVLMTALWSPEIDFASWHYRRDPTHVAFYSEASSHWIAERFGFRELRFALPRIVALRA